MKTKIFVGLCVALGTSFISVCASDTADQAAARAALEQKLYQLDHPQAQPPPDTNSAVVVVQPGESTTNATDMAATNLVATPVEVAPVVVTPAPEAPAPVAPVVAAPVVTTPVVAPVVITPVPEAPAPVAPVEVTPVVVAPPVTTPVVVAPAPKAPVVATRVAVTPAVTARPVATAPAKAKPAAAPATPKPTPARAATKPPSPPVEVKTTNEIATTTGEIYKNVQVEKTLPDGMIISYRSANGGLGMTKVYFEDLSAEVRQKYEKK